MAQIAPLRWISGTLGLSPRATLVGTGGVSAVALFGLALAAFGGGAGSPYLLDPNGQPVMLRNDRPIELPDQCADLEGRQEAARMRATAALRRPPEGTPEAVWQRVTGLVTELFESGARLGPLAVDACERSRARTWNPVASVLNREQKERYSAPAAVAIWRAIEAGEQTAARLETARDTALGGYWIAYAEALAHECRREVPDQVRGILYTDGPGDPIPRTALLFRLRGGGEVKEWAVTNDFGCFDLASGRGGLYDLEVLGPVEPAAIRGQWIRRVRMNYGAVTLEVGRVKQVPIPANRVEYEGGRGPPP